MVPPLTSIVFAVLKSFLMICSATLYHLTIICPFFLQPRGLSQSTVILREDIKTTIVLRK